MSAPAPLETSPISPPDSERRDPASDGYRALDHAVTLTRAMLEAARADDWDRVSALEDERRSALEASGAGAPDAGQAALLGELLDLNGRVLAAARRVREEHRGRLDELALGRRAVRAYGRHD